MLDVNSPLFITMAAVFATAGLAILGWFVQRIIKRLDWIISQLNLMGNRLSIVETEQKAQSTVAVSTATQVGVPSRKIPTELKERTA